VTRASVYRRLISIAKSGRGSRLERVMEHIGRVLVTHYLGLSHRVITVSGAVVS